MTQAQALSMAIDIHPDMEWTEKQLHAKRIYDRFADVRQILRFVEGLEIPGGAMPSFYSDRLEFNLTEYKEWGTYDHEVETGVDIEGTRKNMAKIIKQLGNCTKEYSDAYFEVTKKFGSMKLVFAASRQSVCKKVVTGTKVIPAVPEKVVDVVEWDCEKISFKELEN